MRWGSEQGVDLVNLKAIGSVRMLNSGRNGAFIEDSLTIPRFLFRLSLVLAVVLTLVLSRAFFLTLYPSRIPVLDSLTGSFALDPWTIQLIYSGAVLFILILAGRYLPSFANRVTRLGKLWRWALQVSKAALVTGILFIAIAGSAISISDYWLKPAFRYRRPSEEYVLPEPPFTAAMESFLNREPQPGDPTSAPSGFVLRQLFLMLLLFILAKGAFSSVSSRWEGRRRFIRVVEHTLYVFNVLMFCWVAFSRVWRGAHTAFDIGISIAVGTLVFWPVFFLAISLHKYVLKIKINHTRPGERELHIRAACGEFVFPGLILLGFSFGLSHQSISWGVASAVILSIVGISYLLDREHSSLK